MSVILLCIVIVEGIGLIYYIRRNHALATLAVAEQKKIFAHAERVHGMVNNAVGEIPPPSELPKPAAGEDRSTSE